MKDDKGHLKLIKDLEYILMLAKRYEFHDFKNDMFPAPKMALVSILDKMSKQVKEGLYDN